MSIKDLFLEFPDQYEVLIKVDYLEDVLDDECSDEWDECSQRSKFIEGQEEFESFLKYWKTLYLDLKEVELDFENHYEDSLKAVEDLGRAFDELLDREFDDFNTMINTFAEDKDISIALLNYVFDFDGTYAGTASISINNEYFNTIYDYLAD